eukprot:sb/3465495/
MISMIKSFTDFINRSFVGLSPSLSFVPITQINLFKVVLKSLKLSGKFLLAVSVMQVCVVLPAVLLYTNDVCRFNKSRDLPDMEKYLGFSNGVHIQQVGTNKSKQELEETIDKQGEIIQSLQHHNQVLARRIMSLHRQIKATNVIGNGMGQTLSEPITTKKTTQHESTFCKVASSSMQGWRISMEDAHTTQLSIGGNTRTNFFGVYDGHGGSQSAYYTQENLHKKITSQPAFKSGNVEEALVKAFVELDKDMHEDSECRFTTSGCTSVVVMTRNNQIYCANCGDSRAVLSERGQAIPLSFDHKPGNEEELSRIKAAGGFVEFNRVNGTLALSRALGDFEFKRGNLAPKDQMVTGGGGELRAWRAHQTQRAVLWDTGGCELSLEQTAGGAVSW